MKFSVISCSVFVFFTQMPYSVMDLLVPITLFDIYWSS